MMTQGIRLATAPDRHHERACDELRGHFRFHRPAYHAAGEQVDYGR
jgi:hypothetical protein